MPYSLPAVAYIGSPPYPLHAWSGWLHGLQDEGETFAPVGGTGSGAQIVRTRARESAIEVIRVCTTDAEALAAAALAESWQFQVLPVRDHYGRSFPRVRFHEVRLRVRGCRGNGPDNRPAVAKIELSLRLEVLPDA